MTWRIMRQCTIIVGLGLLIIVLTFTIAFSEAKTIIVDDDGGDFEKIQDAINYSNEGDTIRVYEGIYHENIIVNTSINLYGNGTNNTIISGDFIKNKDVVLISAPRCTLSGFGITQSCIGEFYAGITVTSSNNRILNISSYENDYGIILWRNFNNTISNTECIGNYRSGLHLSKVKHSTFVNITGSYQKNASGLVLQNSSHNTFRNNIFSKNQKNGVSLYNSPNNSFVDNTLTSNNRNGWEIHESSYIDISNSSCASNQEFGISISNSNVTSLLNNNITENQIGIYFHDFCGISNINNNTIYNNKEFGIHSSNTCNIDINAKNNWWGNSLGPFNIVTNPQGVGDNVTSNIDFIPWRTKYIFVDDDAPDGGEGSKERPYNTLLQALHEASSGFTIFINNGTYQENIVINKSISLIGNSSTNTTLIGKSVNDVVKITANNVSISGFKIIFNEGSENNTGMRMQSHGNFVSNCEISVSGGYGIYLVNCDNNEIYDNSLSNNYIGIYSSSSSNNALNNNNFINNSDTAISLIYSNNNTLSNNYIGLYSLSSSNNALDNNNFINYSDTAISLVYSNNNALSNNSIVNCRYGIYLIGATENDLFNNICTNNLYRGLVLYTSESNRIYYNTFSNNYIGGVSLSASSNNTLIYNTISSNSIGIYAKSQSLNNLIQDNIIERNSKFGINAIKNNGSINASNNWWGDSSGPLHYSNNSHGKGDKVTDNVVFNPWIKSNEKQIENYNYWKTILLIFIFGILLFFIIIYLPKLDKIPQEIIIENSNPSKFINSSTKKNSADLENNENSENNAIFILRKNDDYQIKDGKQS